MTRLTTTSEIKPDKIQLSLTTCATARAFSDGTNANIMHLWNICTDCSHTPIV